MSNKPKYIIVEYGKIFVNIYDNLSEVRDTVEELFKNQLKYGYKDPDVKAFMLHPGKVNFPETKWREELLQEIEDYKRKDEADEACEYKRYLELKEKYEGKIERSDEHEIPTLDDVEPPLL